MDLLIWILIIACFVLSFVGIVFPIIPGTLALWAGFLLYVFLIHSGELSVIFWIAMVLLTILLFAADLIANSYYVKKYGGSKWGERVAGVAVIVGSFIIPPFGIIIIPFAAVFVTELIQKRTTQEAWKASLGSLIGFLSGSVAKVVIQVMMIIWFLVEVFWL
ncbi:DUF456 family protein [Radiobacillus kanasensis]|uniref:DUF456 domain-containing protein n=1 Tax=Radiobacillus kanasensis TaxID=2844358 RepID=UPI001E376D66|nr:DUF456 family protein [Radiobacillus kanasensis]UFT99731.1 DUF456 family protein [Radiobacillus kanasensis]